MAKVRTNIEIEDVYVEAIKSRYGVHTKTEAVDLALRHLAGQPMTREQALARMRTALQETVVEGIQTNVALHRELMVDAKFVEGGTSIHYLEGWLAQHRR